MTKQKMKVEIWSDVTCHFCYTAKRKFEGALSRFSNKDHIEVVWKSFELAPQLVTDPNKTLPQFLAGLMSIPIENATQMADEVTTAALDADLVFNLRKAIPANSFNAHRLSHFAKANQLQDKAEETLFKAYFTDGKNIDDISVLMELGTEIGLDSTLLKTVLEGTDYADEVRKDTQEATQLGITSVPHFVFDTKTNVKGAQDSNAFLTTLENTFAAWQKEQSTPSAEMIDGQACEIGKGCN
ncbi:MAG: DsbA family oxidoreductase [Bacteroidota bacterium]